MGQSLQLSGLSLRYHRQSPLVLQPLDLQIAAGEILALVGPSGSGKSSLLRLIAGLERPTEGCIHVEGNCISNSKKCLPPERRNVGLVSQAGDLFPHLNVAKNIAYGLHRWKRRARKERVENLLAAIEMPKMAKRYPSELSGGEAQRVALARALAPRPGVLLLDEPFSSLDTGLRERLRVLTTQMLRKNETTAIFVTHHEEDASTTGDRLIRLEEGRICSPSQ
jgi:iron(III) transport system ATP-binding protein